MVTPVITELVVVSIAVIEVVGTDTTSVDCAESTTATTLFFSLVEFVAERVIHEGLDVSFLKTITGRHTSLEAKVWTFMIAATTFSTTKSATVFVFESTTDTTVSPIVAVGNSKLVIEHAIFLSWVKWNSTSLLCSR